jgi:hypothetical protein
MDISKIAVDFVDDQFSGISGTVTSPELYKPIRFFFVEWKGIILDSMPEDKALYNTSLPWLDAEDKAEVFEAIDTALRKYFKEKFSRVA